MHIGIEYVELVILCSAQSFSSELKYLWHFIVILVLYVPVSTVRILGTTEIDIRIVTCFHKITAFNLTLNKDNAILTSNSN